MQETKRIPIVEKALTRIVSAVLFSGVCILMENKERVFSLTTLPECSNQKYFLMFAAIFLYMTVVDILLENINFFDADYIFLFLSSFATAFIITLNTVDIYIAGLTAFLMVLVARYISGRLLLRRKRVIITWRLTFCCLIILAAFTLLYLGSIVVLRIWLFKTVTFDFGIFVQAFHYMKECLIPYTTCERGKLLSHFTIHFSPVFYLILPVYAIFPFQETLVLFQMAAVVSGVIPLYLMCRKKALPVVTLAVCSAYLLYPTFRGGLLFDFHENKFLAPLVLWLLFFFDKRENNRRKWIGVVVFSALILMVKEDAAIYTACIGLFYLAGGGQKENRKPGFLLFVLSIVYFFVTFHFMGIYGDAGSAITSFGRYENLTVGGYTGIGPLVMNMVKDPAYVISQLMTSEKLEFVIWMFLPVLFLPFRTRRYADFLLLIPLVVLNLLSDYYYQHSIYYQYAYASGVLVIYLTMRQMENMRGVRAFRISIGVLSASLLLGTSCMAHVNTYYHDYRVQKEKLSETMTLLESIPSELSVSATTSFVPPVAQRNEVYRYPEGDESDILIFSLQNSSGEENRELAQEYMEKGYSVYGEVENMVIVLQKDK